MEWWGGGGTIVSQSEVHVRGEYTFFDNWTCVTPVISYDLVTQSFLKLTTNQKNLEVGQLYLPRSRYCSFNFSQLRQFVKGGCYVFEMLEWDKLILFSFFFLNPLDNFPPRYQYCNEELKTTCGMPVPHRKQLLETVAKFTPWVITFDRSQWTEMTQSSNQNSKYLKKKLTQPAGRSATVTKRGKRQANQTFVSLLTGWKTNTFSLIGQRMLHEKKSLLNAPPMGLLSASQTKWWNK